MFFDPSVITQATCYKGVFDEQVITSDIQVHTLQVHRLILFQALLAMDSRVPPTNRIKKLSGHNGFAACRFEIWVCGGPCQCPAARRQNKHELTGRRQQGVSADGVDSCQRHLFARARRSAHHRLSMVAVSHRVFVLAGQCRQ